MYESVIVGLRDTDGTNREEADHYPGRSERVALVNCESNDRKTSDYQSSL